MKEIVLGVWLGIQACIDFKYKEIPLWISLIAGSIGFGFCVIEKRGIEEILLSLVPGMVSLCLSKLTGEVIGYGDGIILIVMGMFLPLRELLSIGMTAFLIAGCVALVLLTLFQRRGNYRIPFVPFLFLAYVMDILIGGDTSI